MMAEENAQPWKDAGKGLETGRHNDIACLYFEDGECIRGFNLEGLALILGFDPTSFECQDVLDHVLETDRFGIQALLRREMLDGTSLLLHWNRTDGSTIALETLLIQPSASSPSAKLVCVRAMPEASTSALGTHLERRKGFEKIIFNLASNLAIYNDESFQETIVASLGEIAEFSNSDRVILCLFNKSDGYIAEIFEWHAPEKLPQVRLFWAIHDVDPTRLMNVLKSFEDGNFHEKLTEEASDDLVDLLESLDIFRALVFPIFINFEIEAFMIFDDPKVLYSWPDEDLSIIRSLSQVIGTAMDRLITEQKLARSEKKYRTILETIKDGYFEISLSGIFRFTNLALCEMVGYAEAELLGKNILFFMNDSDAQRVKELIDAMKQDEIATARIEHRTRRIDGTTFDTETSFYTRLDSSARVTSFYGFTRDITERKKAEKLRDQFTESLKREVDARTKDLNDAFEKQRKYLDEILKASQFKSDFMSTMSHELRTPLNAIIGFTEILLEGLYGTLNEKQLEFMENVHSSADHLLDMISKILDISRIEAGKLQLNLEPVSVREILDVVNNTVKQMYTNKGLEFTIEGMDEDIVVNADPIRIKEILLNLLSNAIKYTIEGSITIKIADKPEMCEFNITDTGIGIAEKDHDRIFKEFERIDSPISRETEGSGLGLSLTKRLVILHGGEISFTSQENVGSTFTFTIPKLVQEE